jgi:Domain of unknown function (DUF397)
MVECGYLVYESDCGENVFDPDDRVSIAQASSIAQADDEIRANWAEGSWVADVVRAPWRKSSWSASNGNCVEVATLHYDLVGVRDSKEVGQGPVLVFDGAAWNSFIESVKSGN